MTVVVRGPSWVVQSVLAFTRLVALTAITGLLIRPVRLYLGWGGTAVTGN